MGGLAKQIGRMKSRQGGNLAAVGGVAGPAAAQPHDALTGVEQLFGGNPTQKDEKRRIDQFDMAFNERLTDCLLARRGRPVARRPPGQDVGDVDA